LIVFNPPLLLSIVSGLLILSLDDLVPEAWDTLVAAVWCRDLYILLSIICFIVEGSSELQQIVYLLLNLTDDLLADFPCRVGL